MADKDKKKSESKTLQGFGGNKSSAKPEPKPPKEQK